MKIMLVDRDSGADRGWIEFNEGGRHLHLRCILLNQLENVVTLFTFCGIKHLPLEPPEGISL